MASQLSPLATFIGEAADNACGSESITEKEFFETFSTRVVLASEPRAGDIARAISEIVDAGKWPYGNT